MLGLPKGKVLLAPWSLEWEKEYENERDCIQSAIGPFICAMHHIGSTAVRGLAAKPIIDMAIEIPRFDTGIQCVAGLERLGYSYKGTNVLPERHYFSKGSPRTHQIHMFEVGNQYLLKQLAFRDCLRKEDSVRQEYEELKRALAEKNSHDKLAYADAKTDFIDAVLGELGYSV
ncbi:MAG: GrpB family protein [Limnochordia bacterium]